NNNPRVRNTQAANYINNVTRSIEAFNTDPGNDQNAFRPGEYLAFNGFVPPPAIDFRPLAQNGCQYVSNSDPSSTFLQALVRSHSVLRLPEYATYGAGSLTVTGGQLAGWAATRQTNVTYSDGVTGGTTNYVSQSGATAAYGTQLKMRNRVAGDFNGDGRRNW